jgi:hypothetical protein
MRYVAQPTKKSTITKPKTGLNLRGLRVLGAFCWATPELTRGDWRILSYRQLDMISLAASQKAGLAALHECSGLKAPVNGHLFLPIRGHLFSPLVAIFSPRWWPRISPPTEVLL